MSKSDGYEAQLGELQTALVRWQEDAIASGDRVVVVFEGRDAAGKDGAIKRLTEHLSTRNTRAVALPKPTEKERTQWYFQRYVHHLPARGEIVVFNRSWYNRAGVEPVMGFCTEAQHERFLKDAPRFEHMLVDDGVTLVKLWLDISREEQAARLESRRKDPLKRLKVSPLDSAAQEKWTEYSVARDEMLSRTHTDWAPWMVVHTDKKKQARLAILRYLLHLLAPNKISKAICPPEPAILFPFEAAALSDGRLER